MSTQEERLRALRWARELLHDVLRADGVRPAIRDDAQRCLQHYPADRDLQAWIDESVAIQPARWGIALLLARTVMQQLLVELPGDDPLRQSARHSERHFPESMWLPGGLCPEPWEPMFLDPTRALRQYGA